ncbi:MAG: hypothetical protein GW768_07585 [Sphingomonadales bacterium]|nr:hypothetical protein [Sphingomonadales bacterium]NCT03799.1 hypothetical protein [Sphingomonadales bacterium]
MPDRDGFEDIEDHWVIDWLNEAKAEDRLLFRTLDAEKRGIAGQRLGALLRLEADEISVGAAGEMAGLTRSAFHTVRRRWDASHELSAVVPFATRRSRGAAIDLGDVTAAVLDGGLESREIALARDLIQKEPQLSNGALGRKLAVRLADGSHVNGMARLVQRVRHSLRLQPEALRRMYGRSLIVDNTAIALLVEGSDGPECSVASLVTERASGLVLAGEVSMRADAPRAFRNAVRRASAGVRELELDVRAPGPFGCIVVMPPGVSAPDAPCTEDNDESEFAYVDSGPRRYGTRTISTLGSRIARIRLVPRYTEPGTGIPKLEWGHYREPLSVTDADGVLQLEIGRWNKRILPRLEACGLAGSGGGMGQLSATLRSLAAQLPKG